MTAVDKSYDNYATSFYFGLMKSSRYNYGGYLFFSTNTTDNVTYFVRYVNSTGNGTLTLNHPVLWYRISGNLEVVSSSFGDRFKGIHLETDLPITLSVVDYNSFHTFLALPCHDYQISQYEYYVVSTGSNSNTTMSQALIVGCQNNTTVTITPSVDLSLPNNTQEPDIDITVSKGISHTVLLHEGQTLYFGAPDVDITGTHIVSDKPITVITGHECTVHMTYFCHLFRLQVPPTVTWGTKYILPSITDAYHGDYPVYVKIITANRDTTITSVCNETVNTTHYDTQGSAHTFYYNNSFNCYVEANKPILVTAFIRNDYSISLTLVPPMEQYSNKIDFSIINIAHYYTTEIIITTTPVGFSPSAILYNGQPITNWTTVYDSSMNIVGYVAEIMDYFSQNNNSRSIVHTNRDGKVSALIHIYYYSPIIYPAGMNLIPINKS